MLASVLFSVCILDKLHKLYVSQKHTLKILKFDPSEGN